MPILRQQPPETDAPTQILAASLDTPEDLEYPHAPLPATSNSALSLVLWSLSVLLGMLMLLVRGPINAPEFEQLTQYLCDPQPALPRYYGTRSQSYALTLRCRTRDQVVYQRQSVLDGSNPGGSKACKQEGGLIRIWRMAPPSPYGAYVFHTTCNNHILVYYKYRAAAYESTQRFVIAIACIIILVSAIVLTARLTKPLRANKIPISGA